jgi:hypothetical protein
VLDLVFEVELFERGISLFDFLCCDMLLNPWLCNELIRKVTDRYFLLATLGTSKAELQMKRSEVFISWLATLSRYGLEFQSLDVVYVANSDKYSWLKNEIEEAQLRQRQQWSNFDILKQGGSLQEIQRCVSEGTMVHSWYDQQGLRLIHLAAAYNRADVLKWLIGQKHSSLNDLDAYGRTVLHVAEASGSNHCALWIKTRNAAERIYRSVASWHHCKAHVRRLTASIRAIVVLQSRMRGKAARNLHRAQLLTRVGESLRFKSLWQEVIESLFKNAEKMKAKPPTWAVFKL